MIDNELKITGILLAGGMSQRMGREKGILKIGNRHLFQYPLKVLEAVCDEILISTCNESTLPAGYPTVCDEVKGIGPIGGIYTCLKRSSNDLNIILSYDLPLVNEKLLRYLIQQRRSYDIVLPSLQKNRTEPLCGIYRKSVVGTLSDMIEKKEYAVHGIMRMAPSRTILINDQMSFWHPDLFLNINHEDDLKKLPSGFGNESGED